VPNCAKNWMSAPTSGDLAHIALDDVLALIIERARRLIEDQDLWVRHERTRAAPGKIVSSGRTKTIQPLEPGIEFSK
jgi:hypothetical protein